MTDTQYPRGAASESAKERKKSHTVKGLWQWAFGNRAPGGASSTACPTRGRTRGISAPGVAETAQREGAPGQEVGAEGGPDPDKLLAVQQQILADVRPTETDNESSDHSTADDAAPKNRRYTGTKREERVGPLRFEPEEEPRLRAAATANGYRGLSGFAADVVLAFIAGRFFIDLPLAEERRLIHEFRARVLRQISGIASNVNQIARALNGGYEPPVDIRRTLDELHGLLTEIAEALRQPASQED
ncbi:MobC family plasmid mobilization relaxosome protein [Kitasatospora sp. NPDC059648]|uniref:MobC family plasmid mobilization relaxosome protein n=1 Tax=Kitasatospora sp. NPDC059648 TaxID=3346894 RepID=UPI0036761353